MSKIIGIDLGTTNSAMAVIEGGKPKIIENAEGDRTTPSVVSFTKTGEKLVGIVAKRQAVINPENTIYGVKRYMGHSFSDKEVQEDIKTAPYKVKEGPNDSVLITLGGKDYRPEEISAMILQKLKKDAEAKLGEPVTEAVITVPAYFNDTQKQATIAAGKIAGLDVKRIIPEPTAAALAYGFNKNTNEKIAVFDFGGGTFDISLLEVGDGVVEVKAVDGDSHLGGRDIDRKIMEAIVKKFKDESGVDVSTDKLALQRIDEASERAKHELSSQSESEIFLPFLAASQDGPKNLQMKLSRAELEDIARPFVDRSIEITKRAIEKSGIPINEVQDVILVGGQTRMPMIQEAVKKLFGKEPNKSINPDEVVADGAAVQAGVLQGDVKDVLLLDVIPLTLGIETMGGVATPIIEKNTTIPTQKSQTFSTAADNQPSVEINIVQGERPMAADDKSLGRFILDGIPPAPRGIPQIEVTFDVDANGVLNVSAKDKTSGKEQSIRIEASSGLSDEDIERMKKEAEENATADAQKKELVEAKNMADQTIHAAERALKDAEGKISDEIKNDVTQKRIDLNSLKNKDGVTVDEIKKATEDLSQAMMKIGEEMSKANQANQTQANPEQSQAGGNEANGGDQAQGENNSSENNNSTEENSGETTQQ